jgi:hypothetical protein
MYEWVNSIRGEVEPIEDPIYGSLCSFRALSFSRDSGWLVWRKDGSRRGWSVKDASEATIHTARS